MLAVEQIEEWLGQEVLDCDGEKVGKLDDVYYAETGAEAVFALVKSGLLGRRSRLVPLAGATVGRDHIKLAFSTAQIEDAGTETNAGETIEPADAKLLGDAYAAGIPSGGFQSANAIAERQRAADAAAERAGELDEEARKRGEEAEAARGKVSDATAEASQKAADATAAREEADRARAEAQRIDPAT